MSNLLKMSLSDYLALKYKKNNNGLHANVSNMFVDSRNHHSVSVNNIYLVPVHRSPYSQTDDRREAWSSIGT
jgi:uncharacterized protein (UPF0276 family)